MTASRETTGPMGANGATGRPRTAGRTPTTGSDRFAVLHRLREVSAPGLVLVFAVAVAVRLAPLLRTGSLTGVLGPADGSYFSASAHLLHGALPYRDVVFGEPPGITVFLLPFTALSRVAGDAASLAVARCAFVLIGALAAVLVSLTLRRVAPQWALPAGLLYATWRLPASAERTVGLEPLLTVGLLVALVLLGTDRRTQPPRPRRLATSGAALGAAAAVSLWAAPAAALVAVFVLLTRGLRAAAIWIGGAAAAVAVLAGPFVAAAPTAFTRQVVLSQFQRATDATLSDRLRRFSDVSRLGAYALPDTIDFMLATCVVVAIAALALTAWWHPGSRLIVLLLALQCAMVATSPDHLYGLFAAAPTLVLTAGMAAHQILPNPWTGRIRRPLAALTAVTATALTLTAVHNVVPRPPDATALRVLAATHRCTWFDTASDAVLADALTPMLERRCAVPVDRLADLQSLGEPLGSLTPDAARQSPGLQARLRAEIAAAGAVVLPADEDDGTLGPALLREVHERFTVVGSSGGLTLWERRR